MNLILAPFTVTAFFGFMAKYRTSATALAKTFEQSSSLIYLLGQDGSIRYINPACGRWLGVEADQLFGSRALYTSEITESDQQQRLNGLAPPPSVFSERSGDGLSTRFLLSSAVSATDDSIRYRWALAYPLIGNGDEELAALIISQPRDLPERPDLSRPSSDAVQLHAVLAELRRDSELVYHLDSLVGTSAFSKRLRRQAAQAASSRSDVYICGPVGSGREHLARTIYFSGNNVVEGNLWPLQGALLDADQVVTVFDDILKQKSAANVRSPSAQGSSNDDQEIIQTLLILDADQMSLPAQLELFTRLAGGSVNVRLLATGKRDLAALALTGDYHWELAAYLGTMKIELIPLERRTEDIPLIVQSLLERPSRQNRTPGFDSSALQLLMEYRWPGNLDQLSSIIEQTAGPVRDRLLGADDLPSKFHHWLRAQRLSPATEITIELDRYLESIERELILRAIGHAKGNKAQAARLLGLSRAKLLRRIEHLSLDQELKRIFFDSQSPLRPALSSSGENLDTVDATETDASSPRVSKLRQKLVGRPFIGEPKKPGRHDSTKTHDDPSESGSAAGHEENDDDWLTPDVFEEVD
jgi:hypothetical protein